MSVSAEDARVDSAHQSHQVRLRFELFDHKGGICGQGTLW